MNKKLLLAVLLPLAVSCGPVSGLSEDEFATTLDEFKAGIKIESIVNEVEGTATRTYYLQNASKEKEFSFIQYTDETRTEKAVHEHYISNGEDNLVYAARLNVNNEYNLYELYNPSTSEYYNWDDGYNNAFLKLEVEDFEKVNNNTYALKDESIAKANNELGTLIYGNPGLTVKTFEITKTKNSLTLSGTMEYTRVSYTYDFESVVLDKGEGCKVDPRSTPFADNNYPEFDAMLESLKGNNYTATVENYEDDKLRNTAHYYTEEEVVLIDNLQGCFGYYQVGEGLCQGFYKQDWTYYKDGKPEEGSLDELRPTFSISPACFDYADGVYTLKDGVEGEIYAVTVLECDAYDLDLFTIEIKTDSYVFTNIHGNLKAVVTITSVGTTDTGIDSSTVISPASGSTWFDVLPIESFNNIVIVAGKEAQSIPAPEGYTSWECELVEDEITFVLLTAELKGDFDDEAASYGNKLIENDYQLIEDEEGYVFGGYMFAKLVEIDDEAHVLVVEVFNYFGAFAVAIYIAE